MNKILLSIATAVLGCAAAGAYSIPDDMLATGLRTLVIETINGEEPTCDKIDAPAGSWGEGITNVNKPGGSLRILNPDGSVAYESGEYVKKESGMTIKVRGNTSAKRAKKPFKIKLEKKADLLCRGDKSLNDKNWVLLTNNNNLYELGSLVGEWVGMPWPPAYEYVNVILNGDFRGLYLLVEAVERNEKCRIITEESGFVAERDAYWWNENGEYLPSVWNPQFNWTLKYPDFEDMTPEQEEYITRYLSDFETGIASENYEDLIDLDSFCRWLIAQDILGTSDGGGTNYYIAKKDNTQESKFFMPVLWDVDSGEDIIEGWSRVHYEPMVSLLFDNANPAFRKKYISLYKEIAGEVFAKMDAYIDDLETPLWDAHTRAVELNNERWGFNNVFTAQHNATDLKDFFPARKVWLDNAVALLDAESSVEEIDGEADSFISVYSIDGTKVYDGPKAGFTPSRKGIFILSEGGKSKKIIL